MLEGTPKNKAEDEKKLANFERQSFGNDFLAKLKSTRRNSFRDFRKEMGPGSASQRRWLKRESIKKTLNKHK